MNLFVIGAGCSKSYEESYSKQRMPIAKDFFKIFNKLDNLNASRWVLVGSIINALKLLKGTSSFDPFKDDFDIEEIHSLFEEKLLDAAKRDDFNDLMLYFKAYQELVFLFSCVVNEISNGPVSQAHINLAKTIQSNDSVITFNWDTLLDRALIDNSSWNTSNGYFVKPQKVFNDTWKDTNEDENYNGPYLLKMHGSANWLTGAITMKPGEAEFQMTQEVSPDTFYVYEDSKVPYDCWDGRWEKVYEPFSYGYYPPNLPLLGKPIGRDRIAVSMMYRSPLHAPKGNAGSSGLTSMPLIIPPVKNKTYDFFGKLFDSIWEKAEEQIINSDKIVFIGYSFPITDVKTVTLFKNAFSKRKTIPKVVIIDPFPKRIIDLMKFELGIPDSYLNVYEDYFSSSFDLSKI